MSMGQIRSGTVTGTGAAINISIGFIPDVVIILNKTDPGVLIWTSDMTAANGIKLTDAPALSNITSLGISEYAGSDDPTTPLAKGFTIGADTDINAASDVLYWIALGTDGGA